MRIVSLVPNATEILFALGAGDLVVGVSHECDFPPEAARLPKLTGSALEPDLPPAAIDAAVSGQLEAGRSLYTLNEARIAALEPTLIVTQTLCPVCAVSADQVDAAAAPLEDCPEVISLDPKILEDVSRDIRALGLAVGKTAQAESLITRLRRRVEAVREAVKNLPRPRVAALEWLDPPFAAGHWIPQMIGIAGGTDVFAAPGDPSRRISWETLAAADPDVIVAMPCGFDRAGAATQVVAAKAHPGSGPFWNDLRAVGSGRVEAVDANGWFSRPGPRLVDGIEELARIFHGYST